MRDRLTQAGLALDMQSVERLQARVRPVLDGDSRRLHQVFMNLLENCLRYTRTGGRLRIDAQVEGGAGGPQLTLNFDDTEPGVAPDELPRLFDRLFRAESSRSRDSGGSGLGLSICRAVVQAHGGTIDASPSPMGGLRITLSLPLSAT